MLVAAIVLNEGALGAENNLPTDDAFGPFVIGIVTALAACIVIVRAERIDWTAPDSVRRPANLEDAFVMLTGEEIE